MSEVNAIGDFAQRLKFDDEFDEFRARSFSGGFPPNSATPKRVLQEDVLAEKAILDQDTTREIDEALRNWIQDQNSRKALHNPVDRTQSEESRKGLRLLSPQSPAPDKNFLSPFTQGGIQNHPQAGVKSTTPLNRRRRPMSMRHRTSKMVTQDGVLVEVVKHWDIGEMRPRVLSLPSRASLRPPLSLLNGHQTGNGSNASITSSIRSFTIHGKEVKKDYLRDDSFGDEESSRRSTPNHSGHCSPRAGSFSIASGPCSPVSAYRVAVVGREGVGKSSVITRFMDMPDAIQSLGKALQLLF